MLRRVAMLAMLGLCVAALGGCVVVPPGPGPRHAVWVPGHYNGWRWVRGHWS